MYGFLGKQRYDSFVRTCRKVSPRSTLLSSGSRIRSFTKHIIASFSTELWLSRLQYAISFPSSAVSSKCACAGDSLSLAIACARAASMHTRMHSDAEPCVQGDPHKAFSRCNGFSVVYYFEYSYNLSRTCITPPPLLPSLKYRKSVGNPIALPIQKDDVLLRKSIVREIVLTKYHKRELPNQSQTIVSSSVQAGLAA